MPDAYSQLIDSSQAVATAQIAPCTSRPAQALSSYQGGVCLLGSDYGSTAKAQVPRVDANGNLSVVVGTPNGGSAQIYTGQPAPTAASQYGQLVFGRQDMPGPSTFNPLTLDPTSAVNVHPKSKQTFRIVAQSILLGQGVILLAMYNGSAAMLLRLNDVAIYIPPSGGSGGALLGSQSGLNYYPVYCHLNRITTYSGGSSVTPCSCDSADTLASGVTVAQKVTSVASTTALFHRADAFATNVTGVPFYSRGDGTGKTLVLRPGEGASIVCMSSGTVNSTQAGGGTLTGSCDIVCTFTQSSG